MTNPMIHATALIHPEAKLGENIAIGPYCVVGPNVELGDNCVLRSHVVMEGHTKVGKNNTFYPFCSIGTEPQDLTYKGEPTRVEIGNNNIFREYVSVHRGTLKQDSVTSIGNDSLFMAYCHFGHDVKVGNKVVIANSTNCAGHVSIGDRVIIGGGTNISQFVSLGRGAYIGGGSGIDRDIPSFFTAYGNRIRLKGINIIGLKRHGFSKQSVSEVVDFYRTMEASAFSPRAFVEHQELMSEYKENEIIKEMVDFIKKSEIGLPPFMA